MTKQVAISINLLLKVVKTVFYSLVIGLAAAAFFLLMVVYVIYKVHWKDRKKGEKTSSINHKTLKNVEHNEPTTFHAAASLPSVASNLSNLWRSSLPNKIGANRTSSLVSYSSNKLNFLFYYEFKLPKIML